MTLPAVRIRLLIWAFLFASSVISAFAQPNPSDSRIIVRPRHKDRPDVTEPLVIQPIPALPPSKIPQSQQGRTRDDRKTGPAAPAELRTDAGVSRSVPSRADGYAPSRPIADVLTRRFGSERFQQILNSVATGGNPGMGASNSDVRFDGSRPRTGLDVVLPAGTQFFSQAKVTSHLKPTTAQDADTTISTYGSIPGGVVLEGIATSLGRIDDFEYDGHVNAFIINGGAVYFARVPPKTIATLCHAIGRDAKGRVGVSLGEKQIVYGAVPADSDLAWDLKMADAFLGDIVFATGDKSEGYLFADGYQPKQPAETGYGVVVFFTFNGFEFETNDEEIRPSTAGLDIQLFPLSEAKSTDGGHLPDKQAIAQGKMAREYETNAEHLSGNISYYRGERIIERMFDYGEVAAILRQLKRNDFDLDQLASRIETSTR